MYNTIVHMHGPRQDSYTILSYDLLTDRDVMDTMMLLIGARAPEYILSVGESYRTG